MRSIQVKLHVDAEGMMQMKAPDEFKEQDVEVIVIINSD